VADLRARYSYLAPASSPSYATYGANDAALGVALFGASTLYAMDPDFATEAEVQRAASGAVGSSSSCGGSSSSGDGGGGSSCGGGGGCGG
jgi:uncharacterized membrane protein YgcG